LAEGDDIKKTSILRRNADKGVPCGLGRFIKKLEKLAGRALQYRLQGRPKKVLMGIKGSVPLFMVVNFEKVNSHPKFDLDIQWGNPSGLLEKEFSPNKAVNYRLSRTLCANRNMNNTLERLQRWYELNCNEDWEHTYGVKIENCDNPGWLITIDLEDTYLQNLTFKTTQHQNADENDWIICKKDNFKFKGAGGPQKLEEMLIVFLEWAEKYEP